MRLLPGRSPPVRSPDAVSALLENTVIAGRFTLSALVGHGGMGFVYRAVDAHSGQSVALKLLHAESAEALHRFSREAAMLAELRHPGIVSYVAHGQSEEGQPFLAMQWLEGEDLARRLARQPLSLQESLSLLRSAAEALDAAHQCGIIHRDLKPSNLFLHHGRPEDVVLLDFGLARYLRPSTSLTGSEVVLGTPGYIAPEQALGRAPLTRSADIFSLGCVLYECLTGKAPFTAPHFVAALAKILFTQPESLRSLRPELPESLIALVEHMLTKEPAQRPPDVASLLRVLEALDSPRETGTSTARVPRAPGPGLLQGEQRLVSVLLAAPSATSGPSSGQPESWDSLRDTLRNLLSSQAVQVEQLADGALVATLVAMHGSASDPAVLAARCALLIQERWPGAAVVLTTGRLESGRPVGEAVDRAGQLLRQLEGASPEAATPVLLDEVTAGLLGPGFQLTRARSGVFQLQGEQLGADESRPLLGRPTPCVGREQELALLELAFGTCVLESAAQAVLVRAPAGMGKSRLRHEFMRRLEREGHQALVLLGRGDPMSAGSADGLLGHALRRLCGVTGAEPLEVRRTRLLQRLSRHLPAPQAQEVAEFLGELCGIPFPDEHSPRLRAARGNPQLLSNQLGRVLVTFLRAECAHHPVLLMLEDLHWGDGLTVRLVDEVLRELAEQPLMVLALSRPDAEQLPPALGIRWTQKLSLRGLQSRAATRLVREVLGPETPDALIERLVEQAAGNPLFLEELIRGEAEARGGTAPETVLAMLQARLGRLEPRARQVLLAASFLGRSFWDGGVSALLGEECSRPKLEGWLEHLVALELVEPQPTSRFPGHLEYRFRHALVRDAAQGLVPDADKPRAHALTGQWLEQAGESDPQVLAEHFRLGQRPERAIHFYTLAAEHHFERNDMRGLERCMAAALALEPRGEQEARLKALQATAAFWMDDFATMSTLGRAVLPHLRAGSTQWCRLMGGLCLGIGQSEKEHLLALFRLLMEAEPEPEARSAYALALCFMSSMTFYFGAMREYQACIERMERTGQDVIAQDGIVRGWMYSHFCFRDFHLTNSPWKALGWIQRAEKSFQEVGEQRNTVAVHIWAARALQALGDTEGAVGRLRHGLALALRGGRRFTLAHARESLAIVLAASPEPAHQQEARTLLHGAVDEQSPNRVRLGSTLLVLARLAENEGNLDEALSRARRACEVLEPFVPYLLPARGALGAVLLAKGRAAEARREVESALGQLAGVGGEGFARVGLLQVLAEACFALGDTATGERALREALACVRSRAEEIPEEAIRERYLTRVPENARVLELARQRWGEAG
ncbi:serine/threonine-protein kinase [Vitiosangium sp. GDMCC 1.1324]|uniref:serine/threonine-protein kinase n=1 Tax=Vitiosangium sp. (strain GDMCC 1.1324) TaxID=2138576 RepID=UPI000D3502CA|nr:serine/threonine-protein kinase [Vitiosangium sp. GDMCC 1.1324]PTL81267.1 serine/threonine-protein kinase PknK [Vitiosangium sp. GDMCC 1.1324]